MRLKIRYAKTASLVPVGFIICMKGESFRCAKKEWVDPRDSSSDQASRGELQVANRVKGNEVSREQRRSLGLTRRSDHVQSQHLR